MIPDSSVLVVPLEWVGLIRLTQSFLRFDTFSIMVCPSRNF